MTTRYVLIDHENVQPKDLARLEGQGCKVIVFVGANQTKIAAELAMALQSLGQDGRYVRVSGNGRNALDMHIAWYLGDLSAREPKAQFHVISKDGDYDPLLDHLRGKDIDARRSVTIGGVLVPPDERPAKAIAYLASIKQNRPRSVKTLANALNALFGKSMSAAEMEELIAQLVKRKVLVVEGTKVTYPSE